MSSRDTIVANLIAYQYDPTRVQRDLLALVKDANYVDPTNPVVQLMESVACTYTAFMDQHESVMRKLYPQLAQTENDLYLHMSDKDYVGRFAAPSTARFSILIAEDELLNRMVEEPSTKSRKVVIPRNSFFTAAGYIFSLQYPIEIRQLQHEGLRVVYDVSKPSPLQTLATNQVDWEYAEGDGGVRWVRLSFDVQQFSIESKQDDISRGKEFSMAMPLKQSFYYARVYVETADGWTEIATTHTSQVYDPTVVTAVLKVAAGALNVRIPQIYTRTILNSKKVRVDMYETMGALDLDLSNYPADKFGATWINYDKRDDTVFTAPMASFQQLIPYSVGTTSGGSAALDLSVLRQRVMKNSTGGEIEYPISTVQIETKLEQNGYGVVLEVDNITERVFLATKSMPTPSDERLITAAAASIETIAIDMEKAAQLDTVVNNGDSITITPQTLYRQDNGITTPVAAAEINTILGMSAEKQALAVSGSKWRFTPFHYVLDSSGNEFDMRAYYLDAPLAVTKSFEEENPTTLLQVSTAKYGIFRTANGYTLQIITTSSEAFLALDDSKVYVQLAYIPDGEKDRAYLNGTYLGRAGNNERVYEFDLATNFNVTSDNLLQLTTFLMYSNEYKVTNAELTTNFDILYSVDEPMDAQWSPATIDTLLGRVYLPESIIGVTHETVKIKFGDALKTLWARSRSYTEGVVYQKYTTDEQMYYENDVYKADASGSIISFDGDGQIVMEVLHQRGDPVLDGNGNPIYKHRKGDVVLDANNNPIPVVSRSLRRMVDLFLIDGTYWFATDVSAVNYRQELTKKLVSWLVDDLSDISKKVLDKTRIYFYPKTTMGMINVLVGDGVTKTIEAAQDFKVRLQVPDLVYRNEALKKQLTATTIKILSALLEEETVSDNAIMAALSLQYGTDVVNMKVTGLGGDNNLTSLRVLDNATRCSLRKVLVALPDGTLFTQESVTVEYERLELL